MGSHSQVIVQKHNTASTANINQNGQTINTKELSYESSSSLSTKKWWKKERKTALFSVNIQ